MHPVGPGRPFHCLFDGDQSEGLLLPESFQALYGRWPLPPATTQPYCYVNFVTSRDGRVSFNQLGKHGGALISQQNRHDKWLMGLLRARADAILVGASQMEHTSSRPWTPEGIFPNEAAAWADLRRSEGRATIPLQVIVTRSGTLGTKSPVVTDPTLPTLVVSTDEGLKRAQSMPGLSPTINWLSTGESLDFAHLLEVLRATYEVQTVLSEAGPNVYGAMIAAGVVDDEFLTLSPVLAGSTKDQERPGLIEGVAFSSDAPPRSRLLSVHQVDDFLFLRSRYR